MSKINAIIIDDEPLAISIVKEYLKDFPHVDIVAECLNGYEGLKAIQTHKPDVLFLDIQMPKINGFELLEILDEQPNVVFTTAFDEYAIKAFELQAVDYLLKPFTKERFAKAMSHLSKQNPEQINQSVEVYQNQEERKRIVVKSGQDIRIIPTQEVYCLEAYDDYVKVHIAKDTYLKKHTLAKFEESLSKQQFVRVHRSFIINISCLKQIEQVNKDTHRAILNNDMQVSMSRSGYVNLKQALGL